MIALPVLAAEKGPVTGLPMPRFASLKSGEANVRTGPGKRYPIDWVFTRAQMPVEIIAEYDNWRKIRDYEGIEGWVHQSILSGNRTILVLQEGFTLRRAPSYNALPVVKLQTTVAASLKTCRDGWCEINVSGYEGWIHHDYIWGVSLDEVY